MKNILNRVKTIFIFIYFLSFYINIYCFKILIFILENFSVFFNFKKKNSINFNIFYYALKIFSEWISVWNFIFTIYLIVTF